MDVLRTPDDRFVDLPDFPFEPRFRDIADGEGGSLRVHFLDEGPPDGAAVLLMHGEPSWSYLYRFMIPPLVTAGYRCIAPDLVGFGKSDKPAAVNDYSYARHVEWMRQLLFEHLDLTGINFFGQDWGGLIGLRLLAEHPHRYRSVVVANTGLPTGEASPSEAFAQWQKFSQESPVFPVGDIIQAAVVRELTSDEVAAYDAPFPDDSHKAGARIFPSLVPTSPDDPASADNRAAWDVLRSLEVPFVTAFSDSDPVTKGGNRVFEREVPGAAGVSHVITEGAGHFLQEDAGAFLAEVVVAVAEGRG